MLCNFSDVWASYQRCALIYFPNTLCYTHRSILDTGQPVWPHIQSFINIKAQPPSLTFTAEGSTGKRNNSQWNEEDGIDSLGYLSQSVCRPWNTLTFTHIDLFKAWRRIVVWLMRCLSWSQSVISNALLPPNQIVYHASIAGVFFIPAWGPSGWG